MLTEMFKTVLLMSAAGSLSAVLLLCLAPATRRLFGPSWQYYIWLAVLVVMIMPIRFSLPAPTRDFFQPTEELITASPEHGTAEEYRTETNAKEAKKTAEASASLKSALTEALPSRLAVLWLLGAIAFFSLNMIKYILFLREMRKNSEPCDEFSDIPRGLRVRKTDMPVAPLIIGLAAPTLFLPNTELTPRERDFILMHELTHHKRGDILYKWFTMLVLSVHWFNPIAHIVSKEIEAECEISCDAAATKRLSDDEKNGYMRMLLNMLLSAECKKGALTTQMATGKKTIKRRFSMIKKKKVGRLMSVISLLSALLLLSATVFASGILGGLARSGSTIEIFSPNGKIELENAPFTENGTIYLPLRETLEKAIPESEGTADIQWNDGEITVAVLYNEGDCGLYRFRIGGSSMELRHISRDDYVNNSIEESPLAMGVRLSEGSAHILKNSTTYISLRSMNYILYGFTSRRDENGSLYELSYRVLSPDGEISAIAATDEGSLEYTTERFFGFFEVGDFEAMKAYCTESCISTYFNGDNVFGIEKASLAKLAIAPSEYEAKDFNAYVEVYMTPSEASVFDPSDTYTSFYLVLKPQSDGKYLIDEFATGLSNQKLPPFTADPDFS